ncbi:MAG: hypothetical protein E7191_05825 [Erysipelotrichaceae bacterium]|nr:hypothetical protein [Erysipelotrichaceae bacterium]MBR3693717.1 competence protein ComK [Erysipelotrichales bacterium]
MDQVNYVYQRDGSIYIGREAHEYSFSMDLVSFIEYCCQVYGTSLLNNKMNCKYILQESQNFPIIFSLLNDIIFLPTKSIHNKECMLVNSRAIQSVTVLTSTTCKVTFSDNTDMDLNCSKTTLLKQIARAHQIRSYFKRNISPIEKLIEEHGIIR